MNVDANRAIGRCLKETRVRQGYTQSQLAGALGRPQSFVSKIESGERSLHLSEIFAHALDVSIGRLMRDIDAALS